MAVVDGEEFSVLVVATTGGVGIAVEVQSVRNGAEGNIAGGSAVFIGLEMADVNGVIHSGGAVVIAERLVQLAEDHPVALAGKAVVSEIGGVIITVVAVELVVGIPVVEGGIEIIVRIGRTGGISDINYIRASAGLGITDSVGIVPIAAALGRGGINRLIAGISIEAGLFQTLNIVCQFLIPGHAGAVAGNTTIGSGVEEYVSCRGRNSSIIDICPITAGGGRHLHRAAAGAAAPVVAVDRSALYGNGVATVSSAAHIAQLGEGGIEVDIQTIFRHSGNADRNSFGVRIERNGHIALGSKLKRIIGGAAVLAPGVCPGAVGDLKLIITGRNIRVAEFIKTGGSIVGHLVGAVGYAPIGAAKPGRACHIELHYRPSTAAIAPSAACKGVAVIAAVIRKIDSLVPSMVAVPAGGRIRRIHTAEDHIAPVAGGGRNNIKIILRHNIHFHPSIGIVGKEVSSKPGIGLIPIAVRNKIELGSTGNGGISPLLRNIRILCCADGHNSQGQQSRQAQQYGQSPLQHNMLETFHSFFSSHNSVQNFSVLENSREFRATLYTTIL